MSEEVTQTISLEVGETIIEMSQYKLTRLDDDTSITVKDRRTTIGSNNDNSYIIADPSVSRLHAEIVAENGGFRLRDLGSKNGTFISDMRIESVFLNKPTIIHFGIVAVEFMPLSQAPKVEIHLSEKNHFGNLLGQTPVMRELFAKLERISKTDETVILQGESGTGKELAARAIHDHSKRKDKVFKVVDCTTLQRDLIESQLFGHVKGAFTGATRDRAGAFASAKGGTIFLDEIGELPLDLQCKLLRVLETKEYSPVGSDEVKISDARVIVATNRNLKQEVEEKRFRNDLFQRLSILGAKLPPLRERIDDIPLLAEFFLEAKKSESHKKNINISHSTMQKLKLLPWQGNVRQLAGFITRGVANSEGPWIETKNINLFDENSDTTDNSEQISAHGEIWYYASNAVEQDLSYTEEKEKVLTKFDTVYWNGILKKTRGNISEAARLSQAHRKTVEYNMNKLGISRSDFLDL